MATPSRTCGAQVCKLEIPESLRGHGLCLDHYLERVFQKLDLAADNSRRGQGVDRNTLDWLLVQVDSIMETMAAQGTVLEPEKRSKLLELLLGIANLNEYIRHQTITVRDPSSRIDDHAG